jgi:hypothetical protein
MESSEAWALPRQATQLHRLEIHAQRYRNRHGEPPAFATLNQSSADLGILEESRFQGFGISAFEYAAGICTDLAIDVRQVDSVTHQAPDFSKLA